MTRSFPAAAVLALAALGAGCTDDGASEPIDGFAAVRTRLDNQPPLPTGEPRGAQTPERQAARERAVRGFIRRATPQPPAVPLRPGLPPVGEGEISLDFQGADLQAVIQVLMEDGLGANYVLDPRVGGTVTLRTNRPIAQVEILPVLEEILRLNNAAIVDRGGVFAILPREEAGQSAPVATFRDVTARGLTVRVTPLRFVTVDDIAELLEGFAPVAGSIAFDRARNMVFSTGTEAEQKTILDVIATVDIDAFAGRSFALRPLREADPTSVADELTTLFARADGSPNAAIRFVPIERMTAVLVIADQPRLLDEALGLLPHLDQGVSEIPELRVYPVANRRASDLAAILGDIFDADVGGTAAGGGSPIAPGLTPRADTNRDRRLGTDGFGAAPEGVDEPAELAESGLTGDGAGGLGGSPFEAGPAPLGEGLSGGGRGFGTSGVVRIVADEASNAIVALATGDGARALEGALRRLDVQPLQVMIEATLLEVQLNDRLEYGVRWFFESGNYDFNFGDLLGSGGANIFPGFNAAFRTTDIQVTLSALDEVTDIRILSSPTLMVLDNAVARLQVGDEVPITTRASQTVDDPDAPIVSETEFRDTGVILEIRPTVNAGGLVVLEIRQEVLDVVEGTGGDVNPTFATRSVESTIAVQSGDTIALAGLIEEDSNRGRSGIPLLSDIPVLGNAFGTTVNTFDRTELIVLIRPFVVRDQTDARAATEELRARLQGLVPRR